ncbi:MAG: rod shape-determining protein MreC [Patescibacteria group bacterium]
MTTISNNRKRKKISPKTAAFLIVITIILVLGLLWRNTAADLVWRALSPILSVRNGTSVASTGFWGQFAGSAQLANENAALRQALATSTALASDRNVLFAENQQLKKILGRTVSDTTILGAVLMRPPGIPYGTLMLDVGSSLGVRKGDLVAAEGSVYIGRILDVYDTTSRVVLFSAPGETEQGLLRGTVPLALVGEGSGSLTAEVPTGIEVNVGDPVILPSISLQYVALVTAVVHPEGQSFQSLYLSLPVNPLELRFVVVHIQSSHESN